MLDCKTVVFFANAKQRGKYSNERSGASVETARENGERREKRGSRASHARVTPTALRAFRKWKKTTVLQSSIMRELGQSQMYFKFQFHPSRPHTSTSNPTLVLQYPFHGE